MSFPETKYMGSKRAILPFIMQELRAVKFDTVLDAFSGSSCVAYAFKRSGKGVVANDFLRFAYHLAKATVENNGTRITKDDLNKLLRENRKAGSFIRQKFAGLYFSEEDCSFLDNIYANIQKLKSPLKRSLVLAALCRACMKKRPRGIFTFVGKKGWDGRRDLRLSMKAQFLEAVRALNRWVFSNGRRNKATCLDVFETSPEGIDLVYIDTPYVSPYSDCDYTRRYHFVEGLCSYWRDVEIQEETVTKKIKSYPTAFHSPRTALDAFSQLFEHFRGCKIALSYGSNGVPSRDELVRVLRQTKKNVRVAQIPHKYSFGNHGHKVGNNNNDVKEFLFIAT